MSSYTSAYPSGTEFKASYKTFFEEFYRISDTPDAHDRYVEQFTEGATLIMASRVCKGSGEILALRHGMWDKIASRKHVPIKIFPFGADSDEVMLYGTVDYGLKEGGESRVDWAARAHLVEDCGKVKMDFYQVYLDTAAMAPKK
ncbi:hypothetical protein FKW77_001545 [Venturia effusa]|uniref:SnoaL-like domain-containing protein n=1 Tax=Venturia effusa TaxID=50376 RepID=A0A517LD95_9PEZI|nr:hypothetical protein FKW77_001545 [Venturia effusa]